MAEFSHGRGLGTLHPNLNGAVSFARQMPSGTVWEEEEEMLSQTQTEGASTPTPTLRGAEEGEREPETLIRTYKDAHNLVVSITCTGSRLIDIDLGVSLLLFYLDPRNVRWHSNVRADAKGCAFIPQHGGVGARCEILSGKARVINLYTATRI